MTQLHEQREQPRAKLTSLTGAGPGMVPPHPPPGPGGSGRIGVAVFVLLHLTPLALLYTGTRPLDLVLCGAVYLIHMFGITAGYHRYFSHRAYRTSRTFQFVLAWLGCTAFQKGPLWWAGIHRHHHKHADTPEDIHSPRLRGFWWSHIGWVLSPSYTATKTELVRDLARYPELRWADRYHWVPPLVLAGLCFLAGGMGGLVWGFFISTILSHHATFLVNSISHMYGSRRFATPDDSRNNWAVAVVTLGEGWHNNHHHDQSSANQGFFWWEIDISYYLIRLLGVTGLVWGIRTPPPNKRRPAEREKSVPGSRVIASGEVTPHKVADALGSALHIPPVVAPVLMLAFWMLLGGSAGIKIMQSIWRVLGFEVGEVSIAVPIGGVVGALAGMLLSLISNPRLLVLLMAVFAGSAAGGVAGRIPWGEIGEVGGQVAGGLVGGMAWAAWMLIGQGTEPRFQSQPDPSLRNTG